MSWYDILTKRLTGEVPDDTMVVLNGVLFVKYNKFVVTPSSIQFLYNGSCIQAVSVDTGAINTTEISLSDTAYLAFRKPDL